MTELWPLPNGWTWERFGDVCQVEANLVDPASYADLPHVAPNHIESETGRLVDVRTVGEDGVKSPNHRFKSGQLLYSKIRPYLAKAAIPNFDGLCSADMYPVSTELEPRYLLQWILTREFTRQAAGHQARTVLPKINKRALYELPVPVAPCGEQVRVAEILEDHLSHLDATQRQFDLARTRLSMLLEATLQNSTATVETKWLPLKSLVSEPFSNGRSVKSRPGGFPVLRLTALKSGHVDLEQSKEGDWDANEAAPFCVTEGDFLLARGNGSLRLVGRGALVSQVKKPVAYPDTMIRIRVDAQKLHPPYFRHLWNSHLIRQQIEKSARTTAGIYKINQRDLGLIRIPIADFSQQVEISHAMDVSASAFANLEAEISRSQQRVAALRRAVLRAAFEGRLAGSSKDSEVVEELAQT